MEDHDYAELGAPKSSNSKKSKKGKQVKQVKTPNGTASLNRPTRDKRNGDVRKKSSTYEPKDSKTVHQNGKKVDSTESMEIAPYATIPRKSDQSKRPNGSVTHTNGDVQSRDRPPHAHVHNTNGSARKDSKEMPEATDFSGLYAKVSKRENGDMKPKETKVSLKEKKQTINGQEEDFSQLYAEVNKSSRKQRPQKEVSVHDRENVTIKTNNIQNSASKDDEKPTDEVFESNPYTEIKRRTSYHGKENIGSPPRSAKRGSISLSFRSFRSQKSDVTDEGNESLTSNSLYNLIPEEPDTPLPDIEFFEEAPPPPAENTVPKGQDNSAFQTESANNVTYSRAIDVANFEDEGYKEAVRRRDMVKKKQETQKRRLRFLVVTTVVLLVVLLLVIGVVVFLLISGGYFD